MKNKNPYLEARKRPKIPKGKKAMIRYLQKVSDNARDRPPVSLPKLNCLKKNPDAA